MSWLALRVRRESGFDRHVQARGCASGSGSWGNDPQRHLGLTRSPEIADLAAESHCALVLMHNQDGTDYAGDVMDEIKVFLRTSIDRALRAGVPRERVLIDPGIGFGKTAEQNWVVMRRLSELRELGQPILIGTSRKSFIGKLLDLPSTSAWRARRPQ